MDRFLTQHVFHSVTVFFLCWTCFSFFFFYKNNNKNEKDNTMRTFMAMLLNGFCTSRGSRCSVAVLGRASPAFGDASPKLQKKKKKRKTFRRSVRMERFISTQSTVPQQREDALPVRSAGSCSCAPPSSSLHHYEHLYLKNKIVSLSFREYYLYSKNPGDEK